MRADEIDAANLPREWGRSQEAHGVVRRAWGPDFVGVAPRLSRRGFLVDVPCHWHCSRNGHARQWPMRAAYTTRSVPSRSGRRAFG